MLAVSTCHYLSSCLSQPVLPVVLSPSNFHPVILIARDTPLLQVDPLVFAWSHLHIDLPLLAEFFPCLKNKIDSVFLWNTFYWTVIRHYYQSDILTCKYVLKLKSISAISQCTKFCSSPKLGPKDSEFHAMGQANRLKPVMGTIGSSETTFIYHIKYIYGISLS